MKKVTLRNLQSGMILAEPVHDMCGRILLQKDIELSESSIRILKTWGVAEVRVQGEEGEADTESELADVDPQVLDRARQHIKTLFRHAGEEDNFVKDLKRLVTIRKIRILSKDTNGTHSS